MTRRDFLRSSAVATTAALLTGRLSAADASAVLASTSALDADVVEGLTRLVDTLVTRQF